MTGWRGPERRQQVVEQRDRGVRVSDTTIWKLRNGQAANPQMKPIEVMAHTFGVPPGANLEAMMGIAVRAAARPGQRRLVYRLYRCAALADVATGLVTGCLGARSKTKRIT